MIGTPPTVVFDFFGVIAYEQDPAGARELEDFLGMSARELWPRYWSRRRAYDLAETDGTGFWSAVAGVRLDEATVARLVALDVASWSRVDAGVVDVVRELLRTSTKVGLLSNLPLDLLRWHRANTPVVAEFHVVRASCVTGLAKPDAASFTGTLDALGARPDEAVLVDDHAPNVEAARGLGMRAVLFKRGMDLRDQLSEIPE